MAGHSKWAQIKRKKAVTDARRGQLFTKLLKEISVSARLGGGDSEGNARLRSAIQEARSNNVPNDNIERAILRGTGELEGVTYEDVTYEGYGPGGAAILIEAVTDNRNRTVAELRHLFSKHGGNLGESGCVAWMFEQQGYFVLEDEELTEERLIEIGLELEVDDFNADDEGFELYSSAERFADVRDGLERMEIATSTRELAWLPKSYMQVDPDKTSTLLALMEALEEHDDVQSVWANFDIDAEVLVRQET